MHRRRRLTCGGIDALHTALEVREIRVVEQVQEVECSHRRIAERDAHELRVVRRLDRISDRRHVLAARVAAEALHVDLPAGFVDHDRQRLRRTHGLD